MTLSPLHLWGNTRLRYLTSGLGVQISLRVDTPTIPVNVLISERQEERASSEVLANIVQSDSEYALER